MKVLIIGVDSDIGSAIAEEHRGRGDVVETTSRNDRGTYDLELAHPLRWPSLTAEYDAIYYCIGIDDLRTTRIEVMQINALMAIDCIGKYAKNLRAGGTFVALTTSWGSAQRVAELTGEQANRSTWYKMSRAAFNMGVTVMSRRYQQKNWVLMHPGVVRTKGTERYKFDEYKIDAATSASGIVTQTLANTKQLAYIDYQGNSIPL